MKVVTRPHAAALVRESGGRLYVWAKAARCCGGTRFVEASTKPPRDLERFRRIQTDPVELFVPGRRTPPSQRTRCGCRSHAREPATGPVGWLSLRALIFLR